MSLLTFVVLLGLLTVNAYGGCPNAAWYKFRNKCYLIKSELGTLSQNVQLCKELNATMVSIHSQEENDFLKNMLVTNRCYMIGLRQLYQGSGIFSWMDGTPLDYTHWHPGYPKFLPQTPWAAHVCQHSFWGDTNGNSPDFQLCQIVLPDVTAPVPEGVPLTVMDDISKSLSQNQRLNTELKSQLKDVTYMQKETFAKVAELATQTNEQISGILKEMSLINQRLDSIDSKLAHKDLTEQSYVRTS